jgi:hypothetical protein
MEQELNSIPTTVLRLRASGTPELTCDGVTFALTGGRHVYGLDAAATAAAQAVVAETLARAWGTPR